jgi:PAS domain S-box-containing protein
MVDTIHPEDRDRVMAQFWTAVGSASTYRLEFRLNSDSLCWVTAEGSIERDAHGQPVRVCGVTHDITERKKAELALAEREAQLGLAVRAARVGSFAVDYATERIQTSTGYAAIHGLAEGTEELTREEWRARLHPDDLARLDALRSQVFAERRPELNIEYRIVGADGKARWIESRGLVSYDGDGHPTRLVGVHIDITERKRAEDRLQESERKLRELLGALPAAIYVTDAEGHITYCNQSAVDLWGWAGQVERLGNVLSCRRLPDGLGRLSNLDRIERRSDYAGTGSDHRAQGRCSHPDSPLSNPTARRDRRDCRCREHDRRYQ